MRASSLLLLISLALSSALLFAGHCGNCIKENNCPPACDTCCGGMGGIQYCDSSAGRYVCNNGFYSACYCDRHAVMDIDNLQGCCLWQGGVLHIDNTSGAVICNNGSVSEVCTLSSTVAPSLSW